MIILFFINFFTECNYVGGVLTQDLGVSCLPAVCDYDPGRNFQRDRIKITVTRWRTNEQLFIPNTGCPKKWYRRLINNRRKVFCAIFNQVNGSRQICFARCIMGTCERREIQCSIHEKCKQWSSCWSWNFPAAGKQTKLNLIGRIRHVTHFRANSVHLEVFPILNKIYPNLDFETKIVEIRAKLREIHHFEIVQAKFWWFLSSPFQLWALLC